MATRDSTSEKVVADVARDLDLSQHTLEITFQHWLADPHHPAIGDEYRVACYAVYRLTKLTGAFQIARNSRVAWREVALALGASPVLHENSQRP